MPHVRHDTSSDVSAVGPRACGMWRDAYATLGTRMAMHGMRMPAMPGRTRPHGICDALRARISPKRRVNILSGYHATDRTSDVKRTPLPARPPRADRECDETRGGRGRGARVPGRARRGRGGGVGSRSRGDERRARTRGARRPSQLRANGTVEMTWRVRNRLPSPLRVAVPAQLRANGFDCDPTPLATHAPPTRPPSGQRWNRAWP